MPMASGCVGLPENIPTRGAVLGTTLLHGGTDGTGSGQHHPPPAQAHSPLAGPFPVGLDVVHLLGIRFLTLRRLPITASSSCARVLTCLLQALEREQTCETLTRLLILLRVALVGKAKRSPSTQLCRISCLAAVMDPLGELIASIHRQATTDGPRTRAKVGPRRRLLPPKASDRTAAAVRALLVDGPSKS